jgi:hypothetical protein
MIARSKKCKIRSMPNLLLLLKQGGNGGYCKKMRQSIILPGFLKTKNKLYWRNSNFITH